MVSFGFRRQLEEACFVSGPIWLASFCRGTKTGTTSSGDTTAWALGGWGHVSSRRRSPVRSGVDEKPTRTKGKVAAERGKWCATSRTSPWRQEGGREVVAWP